jgi:glutaredoxin
LFPSCAGIFTFPDDIPGYLIQFSKQARIFKNVDPEIFWIYFKFLHTYSESELGYVIRSEWKTDAKIKERLEEVSKMIYSRRNNPNLISNKQNLRLSIIKGDFVLYTRDGCSACQSAKKALFEAGIEYLSNVKDVNTIPEGITNAMKLNNHTTVPVLVVNGVFIGGSEELINILNSDQIRPKIRQIGEIIQSEDNNTRKKNNNLI